MCVCVCIYIYPETQIWPNPSGWGETKFNLTYACLLTLLHDGNAYLAHHEGGSIFGQHLVHSIYMYLISKKHKLR